MTKKLSPEKVIEHHLAQNMDQKITPHLVAGLTLLIAQNLRNTGMLVEARTESEPTQ